MNRTTKDPSFILVISFLWPRLSLGLYLRSTTETLDCLTLTDNPYLDQHQLFWYCVFLSSFSQSLLSIAVHWDSLQLDVSQRVFKHCHHRRRSTIELRYLVFAVPPVKTALSQLSCEPRTPFLREPGTPGIWKPSTTFEHSLQYKLHYHLIQSETIPFRSDCPFTKRVYCPKLSRIPGTSSWIRK